MNDPATYSDDDLASLARSVTPRDRARLAPPDEVWSHIAAEVASPGTDAPAETNRDRAVVPLAASRLRRASRSPRRLLAAAAALVIGTVTIGYLSTRGDDVSEVALGNLGVAEASTASGKAHLVEHDGRIYLDLSLASLPRVAGADIEVWLIDAAIDDMVSLGTVQGDGKIELAVPVDPKAFPIIDLSIEPKDGNPAHSGKSILRGKLD